MTGVPIDEAAIEQGVKALVEVYGSGRSGLDTPAVEAAVSAYLEAVGATVERRGGFVADPKRKGIVVHQDKEARVVTDWKPLTDTKEEQ